MLDTIPAEVLAHIALHLTLPTCEPPANLLQTNKTILNILSPQSNPRLYARVYRARFDTAAAERRLGDLNAVDLTAELGKRVRALARLSRQIRMRDVKSVRDDDLWVIYVMLIENDGKNLEHLLADGGAFHLPTFLKLYHEQHLLTAAVEPGYPDETIGRALAMWIAWLLSGYGRKQVEPSEQRDERLFVLRPYVFMAQRYELFHAPWTIQDLPLARPDHQSNGVDLNSLVRGPWITDLIPKSRAVEIEMYGRKVSICPPLLAHAAILRFFSKKMPGEMVENLMSPLLAMNRDDEGESRMRLEMDVDEDDDEHMMAEAGTSQSLILDSRQHDRDFQRLASCYNPSLCRGMKRAVFRGSWEGCWEGNFSFFDFDAFGLMMAGQSSALYEGPYGEQAQVWRLKETFVRPKRSHKGKARAGTLPVRGPMTNAGFPTTDQYQGLNAGYQPPSRTTGWASAAAEALTMQDTIRQLVGAFDEYEIVPDDEVEHALADGGGEEAGLEMILSGTGHSAWGRFVIKGRVRAWDGLASIVKEYTPDSRGKWIYRGYILAGDVFVGRWRDTYTPETFVGYEGTFILNRR